MPLLWSITIYASTLAFGVTAFIVRGQKLPWLSLYLFACVPAGIFWAEQAWMISRWIRPVVLELQAMAVIEAIWVMQRNCWKPRRRYLIAAFGALLAIAATFGAIEYPVYPRWLWWCQVWIEAGSVAACFITLVVFAWFRNFTARISTIGNLITMMIYCGIEILALLWPTRNDNWVGIDITLALVQDCCLFWWCILNSRDA